jgi:uncharacterized protein YqjF (DUF2071 family)
MTAVPTSNQILKKTAHRNWPPPDRPWLWSQGWQDLLFCHWAVSAEALQSHVPSLLEIDVMDGSAWVSVVAFRMAQVRPRWFPPFPPVSNFLELNLRTYVRSGDNPGVFFLSIHANKRLAARISRFFSPLPYVFAPMTLEPRGDGFHFHCQSTNKPQHVSYVTDYRREGVVYAACQDCLTEWLLERYRLYVGNSKGDLIQAEVHHEPWMVQNVNLEIFSNTLGQDLGLDLPPVPDRAHFSSGVKALAWSFEPELNQTINGKADC